MIDLVWGFIGQNGVQKIVIVAIHLLPELDQQLSAVIIQIPIPILHYTNMTRITNNVRSIDGLDILYPGHKVVPYILEEGPNDLTLIDTCY
jgi:hypothetical protein